jgi:hypothetical protein
MIKSRRLKWEHVACVSGYRNAYRILVKKPEGERTLERPRRRRDDTKMDLRERGP